MPTGERDKQNTWGDLKMLVEKGFISEVEQWLVNADDNDDDVIVDVNPDDSKANVASKRSNRTCSGKNRNKSGKTTSFARIKAVAEKAVLLVRAAALKGKRDLEAQEEQRRRKREQLELDAKIATSTAELAVLQAVSVCLSD